MTASAPTYRIRLARADDVSLLVEARRHMFEELDGPTSGASVGWMDEADRLLAEWLPPRMADGRASGFIAEGEDGRWLGALSVAHEDTPPSRGNPTGRQSYLFGLWVAGASRRQGVASALVSAAIERSRDLGEGAVTLFASDEGRKVYEPMGFVASPHMRMFFEPLDRPDPAGGL